MKEKPLPLRLFRQVEKHFALPSVECVILKDGKVILEILKSGRLICRDIAVG